MLTWQKHVHSVQFDWSFKKLIFERLKMDVPIQKIESNNKMGRQKTIQWGGENIYIGADEKI
jgi:hypothetical protein